MDIEDGLFVAAIVLIGAGVGCYSPPAGAIAIGLMLALPPLVSLFRRPRNKDGDK